MLNAVVAGAIIELHALSLASLELALINNIVRSRTAEERMHAVADNAFPARFSGHFRLEFATDARAVDFGGAATIRHTGGLALFPRGTTLERRAGGTPAVPGLAVFLSARIEIYVCLKAILEALLPLDALFFPEWWSAPILAITASKALVGSLGERGIGDNRGDS